jgi:hypothetical protein
MYNIFLSIGRANVFVMPCCFLLLLLKDCFSKLDNVYNMVIKSLAPNIIIVSLDGPGVSGERESFSMIFQVFFPHDSALNTIWVEQLISDNLSA